MWVRERTDRGKPIMETLLVLVEDPSSPRASPAHSPRENGIDKNRLLKKDASSSPASTASSGSSTSLKSKEMSLVGNKNSYLSIFAYLAVQLVFVFFNLFYLLFFSSCFFCGPEDPNVFAMWVFLLIESSVSERLKVTLILLLFVPRQCYFSLSVVSLGPWQGRDKQYPLPSYLGDIFPAQVLWNIPISI